MRKTIVLIIILVLPFIGCIPKRALIWAFEHKIESLTENILCEDGFGKGFSNEITLKIFSTFRKEQYALIANQIQRYSNDLDSKKEFSELLSISWKAAILFENRLFETAQSKSGLEKLARCESKLRTHWNEYEREEEEIGESGRSDRREFVLKTILNDATSLTPSQKSLLKEFSIYTQPEYETDRAYRTKLRNNLLQEIAKRDIQLERKFLHGIIFHEIASFRHSKSQQDVITTKISSFWFQLVATMNHSQKSDIAQWLKKLADTLRESDSNQ